MLSERRKYTKETNPHVLLILYMTDISFYSRSGSRLFLWQVLIFTSRNGDIPLSEATLWPGINCHLTIIIRYYLSLSPARAHSQTMIIFTGGHIQGHYRLTDTHYIRIYLFVFIDADLQMEYSVGHVFWITFTIDSELDNHHLLCIRRRKKDLTTCHYQS